MRPTVSLPPNKSATTRWLGRPLANLFHLSRRHFFPQRRTEDASASRVSGQSLTLRCSIVEYVRYARRQELKTLSRRVEMQDNWRGLEKAEARAADESKNSS